MDWEVRVANRVIFGLQMKKYKTWAKAKIKLFRFKFSIIFHEILRGDLPRKTRCIWTCKCSDVGSLSGETDRMQRTAAAGGGGGYSVGPMAHVVILSPSIQKWPSVHTQTDVA